MITDEYRLYTFVMNVRERLIDEIVAGSLQPGALNESQLATWLGISRTPVREALLTLDPFVFRKDRGFELTALSPREAKEVYLLIGTLESLALDYVVLPISLDAVEKLTVANEQVRGATTPEAALNADSDWHRTLISFSRNRTVRSLVEKYRLVVARYEFAYFSVGGAPKTAADDHELIADCILRNDLESAKEVLRENWLRGLDAIAEKIEWL